MRELSSTEIRASWRREETRADVALLILSDEDAVDAAREQPGEIGPAQRDRRVAVIVAIASEHIEGIELRPRVVLARTQDGGEPRLEPN
jgi:hypothetical protein